MFTAFNCGNLSFYNKFCVFDVMPLKNNKINTISHTEIKSDNTNYIIVTQLT